MKIEELIKNLNLKTPPEEIKKEDETAILNFLFNEKKYQEQYKIRNLLKRSGVKHVKMLSQFDWQFNPKVPRTEIVSFSKDSWITRPMNLVMIGDTGLGKSHIATALCYDAILNGHPTIFITAFDLLSKIKNVPNPSAKIEHYSKIKVLAIDELGYTFHKKEDTDIIFQIISKRSEVLPTIITTNLSPKDWGSVFSGPAASAILDRLSFNGSFLTFEGRSYRSQNKKRSK